MSSTTKSSSNMVATGAINLPLTRLPDTMSKPLFAHWKTIFLGRAGSLGFLKGLTENWGDLRPIPPGDDPGAMATVQQHSIYGSRRETYRKWEDECEVSRAKAWEALLFICEDQSTLQELVTKFEGEGLKERNKLLWEAICAEYETMKIATEMSEACFDILEVSYVDTGNMTTDFKTLCSAIDKAFELSKKNGIELPALLKFAKVQNALSKVALFDDFQITTLLGDGKDYNSFVAKIKSACNLRE